MYSQSSSGFPPQQYGQAPRQSQQAYNQQSLLSNPASHSSFPMDRPPNAHPYLPQQMSHPLGNQISGQLGNPMSHQLSQSGSKSFNQPSDLSLYLLSQQISQGLPQYAQIGSQPGNQNIPGLSALDEQLKTLNLQNNRPYDAPQPYQGTLCHTPHPCPLLVLVDDRNCETYGDVIHPDQLNCIQDLFNFLCGPSVEHKNCSCYLADVSCYC